MSRRARTGSPSADLARLEDRRRRDSERLAAKRWAVAAEKYAAKQRALTAARRERLEALLEAAPPFELRPEFKSWFEQCLSLPVSRSFTTAELDEIRTTVGRPSKFELEMFRANQGGAAPRPLE